MQKNSSSRPKSFRPGSTGNGDMVVPSIDVSLLASEPNPLPDRRFRLDKPARGYVRSDNCDLGTVSHLNCPDGALHSTYH